MIPDRFSSGEYTVVIRITAILLLALMCVMVTGVAGCNTDKHTNTVNVFSAVSTIDAMNEVVDAFHSEQPANGIRIRTNFAATSTLAAVVLRGTHPDLFLSANLEWSDIIVERNPNCTSEVFLSNQLVLVTSAGSGINDLQITELGELDRIALADPGSVPAGQYAKKLLKERGLWQSVSEIVVGATDVRQALAFVQQGVVDAGFVYRSDVAGLDDVVVLASFDFKTVPIQYPLIQFESTESNMPKASSINAFLKFLATTPAQTIFEKHGFNVLRSPTARRSP